jgi:hypothetical protein
MPNVFPAQNSLKFSALFFSIGFQPCLKFTSRAQEIYERLELKGTYHILVWGDGVNIFGENMDILRKNNASLLDASKEVGLK